VLADVAITFGVAAHTACQAIEHHDGAKDAVALCAAAVALAAVVLASGRGRCRIASTQIRWLVVLTLVPAAGAPRSGPSSAWLQRFRN
jgi:hypothetical protein